MLRLIEEVNLTENFFQLKTDLRSEVILNSHHTLLDAIDFALEPIDVAFIKASPFRRAVNIEGFRASL